MEWLEQARCFLKQDTYPGECKYTHKDRCKQLGARWRNSKWTALSKEVLFALCDSGTWHPVGMGYGANEMILRLLLVEKEELKEADMSDRKRRAGPTDEEKKASRLKEFGIAADEPDLLEDLASKGITPHMVNESGEYNWLGPRSGISNASRLLRGVKFGLVSLEDVIAGTARDPSNSGTRGKQAGVRSSSRVESARPSQPTKAKRRKKTPQEEQAAKARERVSDLKGNGFTGGAGKEKESTVVFIDAEKCEDCAVVVDRYSQFMECNCGEKRWKSCMVCLRPIAGFSARSKCDYC